VNGTLTFTLCWTDPPGTVDSINYKNNHTPKLVNDLDLTVSEGSSIYLPWVLDIANPAMPAIHSNNSVDNVEKIEIPYAVAGKEYTITINHKGQLRNGFQDYSFVASGVNGVKTTAENPLGLMVIPNPATNNCIVRFKSLDNSDAIITVMSINGRKIKEERIPSPLAITNYPINLSVFNKGLYLIHLEQGGKNTTVKMEKL
jgi:hypothetical protein